MVYACAVCLVAEVVPEEPLSTGPISGGLYCSPTGALGWTAEVMAESEIQ